MFTQGRSYDTGVIMYCCMYNGCGSEYATKFNLKRHVESVHMKIKKFKCNTCGMMFSSKQSLKEHFHIHLNTMPFKCVTCEVSFRQASQLSLHKRAHAVKGTASVFTKNTADADYSMMQYTIVEPGSQLEKFSLPEVSHERRGVTILPFPKVFFLNSEGQF